MKAFRTLKGLNFTLLQADKLYCHIFTDRGRTDESPGLETQDELLPTTIMVVRLSSLSGAVSRTSVLTGLHNEITGYITREETKLMKPKLI
jgi:hypothetical protein